jgi:hypothetical protein
MADVRAIDGREGGATDVPEGQYCDRLDEDVVTVGEAVATVAILHSETLGISRESISSGRADSFLGKDVQTTTEALLLLARFHLDTDDARGAELLARFAVEFAAYESTVV